MFFCHPPTVPLSPGSNCRPEWEGGLGWEMEIWVEGKDLS